ncbi:MAG: putative phosphoslipid binding protein [Bryobacterales bacterium]|nr:putative phosphoslipid binding protein [Bryobacterales bacterium]
MKKIFPTGMKMLAVGAVLACASFAQQPDNTAVNKQDRDKTAPTADNQKNNVNDRDTTRKIRQAIIADKTLSSYAHNVKIITKNGTVTLKGPVRTEEEKSAVEAKAKEVAGPDKVTSEISVAPKKS